MVACYTAYDEELMMKKILLVSPLLFVLIMTASVTKAADEVQVQKRMETQQQVYGYQLMTNEERMEMRNKMTTAKTAEERERIQAEHHERMKIRAKEQGVTLPDQPMMKGGAMGKGTGMGAGAGSGQKQGSGQGRGK
jgi:hypothetical protein